MSPCLAVAAGPWVESPSSRQRCLWLLFSLPFPTMQKNLWHMWVHPHGVDTTGALDLGGASTQISFVAGEKMEPNASDTVQVSLYGYTYTLYTHSFQCYGQNEAEKKFLAMLLQVPGWECLSQRGGLPSLQSAEWIEITLETHAILGFPSHPLLLSPFPPPLC